MKKCSFSTIGWIDSIVHQSKNSVSQGESISDVIEGLWLVVIDLYDL